jgi:DNA adenine methylase
MSTPPLVPPVKCQGIKTKLVEEIRALAALCDYDRWVEPFCGSCVVPLNIQPPQALLCDSNTHIIRLYQDIQAGRVTAAIAKTFLSDEGEKLRRRGEEYYYEVRERFNDKPTSLDFLFLNRSCFNGIVRFNRSGEFNVPFCRKPDRFAQPYISKIANQVRRISEVLSVKDWTFEVADFRTTLNQVTEDDFVYADPPYAGRHVDYFNSWSEKDESDLAELLKNLPGKFVLSTWHSNEFRTNPLLPEHWSDPRFRLLTRQHFYHVGSTEDLRHAMVEALVTNLPGVRYEKARPTLEQLALFERPFREWGAKGLCENR